MLSRAILMPIAALLGCVPADAAIRINVYWHFVEDRQGSGRLSSPASTLFLMEGNHVTDDNATSGLLRNELSGVRKNGGVPYSVRYQIRNGSISKILRISGTNVRVAVRKIGQSSCAATVTYVKNPGKTYFETTLPGTLERVVDLDQHAEDVTCVISSE